MSGRIVSFNGRFVPEHEARVSIYDTALTYGDMAFEVLRTFRHEPFLLREHLARLEESLAALGVSCGLSADALAERTGDTLRRNLPTEPDFVEWQIMINVSAGAAAGYEAAVAEEDRGPTVVISCFPLVTKLAGLAAAFARGVELVVPAQRAIPGGLLPPHVKTRSRLHYRLAARQAQARRPGAVPLLVDPAGRVCETNSGNLFLVRRGRLVTPPLGSILPGITRGFVLELAAREGVPSEEAAVSLEEAAAAEEMFVTSTSIGILHARSLEDHLFGDGTAGPVTRLLRAAFHRTVGQDIVEEANRYAAWLTGRRA